MIALAGSGQPLTQAGFAAALAKLDVEAASLWAVLSVETSGFGFQNDKQPKILFERHIFSRLTKGAYDASHPDISNPTPGGYGAAGSYQYTRLNEAMALNQDAALQAASWGLGQIMGMNYKTAGFTDVEAMVTAMVAGEDGQLAAMAAFVLANGMAPALQSQDWASFARRYNGPNYAQNAYDTKLANYYARAKSGHMPDLRMRAVQAELTYRGISPGGIDGLGGPNTGKAISSFQIQQGMAATGTVTPELLAALGLS